MDSKHISMIPCCILVLMFLGFATCDIDKDKERCANDLAGLAPCLGYVSGEAKAPSIDCCNGYKQVLEKSAECICVLVKDRNDPSLGLTINATRALGLSAQCHVPSSAPSISDCPGLLHLPPNSPDAKVFEDFANSGKKTNATAPAPVDVANARGISGARTAARGTSHGATITSRWLRIPTLSGLLLTLLLVRI